MLDAALDAVAAADIDILVHAHSVAAGGAARGRSGPENFGIWIEAQTSRISRHGSQLRDDAEGLDRHGGAAAPASRGTQDAADSSAKSLFDVAPDEGAVEQDVGAVVGMDRGARRIERCSPIDDVRQRLVIDRDHFGGIFGQRAGFGDHRHHPFTGIAHTLDRQRKAPHLRRIERRSSAASVAAREFFAGHNA